MDNLEERIETALHFVANAEAYMRTFDGDAVYKSGMQALIADIRAALEGKEEFSFDQVMKEWRRDD